MWRDERKIKQLDNSRIEVLIFSLLRRRLSDHDKKNIYLWKEKDHGERDTWHYFLACNVAILYVYKDIELLLILATEVGLYALSMSFLTALSIKLLVNSYLALNVGS